MYENDWEKEFQLLLWIIYEGCPKTRVKAKAVLIAPRHGVILREGNEIQWYYMVNPTSFPTFL